MSEPGLRLESVPRLRRPVLLAAFAGWNDASEAATFALTSLVRHWSPEEFARVDPEDFYVFTETRPTIALDDSGQRALNWPSNVFYAHSLPEAQRDVAILIGTEPQLKWRTYCRYVVEAGQAVNASCLITLGGLLADVPHTAPPQVTGFAWPQQLMSTLHAHGVETSSYEGPTGIVGVLHDAWRQTRLPSLSLWGHVPHYISASPNPQVTLALLRRLSAILGTTLPLTSLETQASAFSTRVDEALADNPEALEYVRQLEAQTEIEPPHAGPQLIKELEEFLRIRREESDEGE